MSAKQSQRLLYELAAIGVEAPNSAAFVDLVARLLGKRWRWVPPLAKRLWTRVEMHPPESGPITPALFRSWLDQDTRLRDRLRRDSSWHILRPSRPPMKPQRAAAEWLVPPLRTTRELADWLSVSENTLDWLGREGRHARRRSAGDDHYHYRVLTKRFGKTRLIEAPKPNLKLVQRRLVHGLLAHIPLHPAVHGFCPQRSILTFAEPHVGQAIVVRIDLEDFFPSILAGRVRGVFRTAGYPDPVSSMLTQLCTHQTPREAWPLEPEFSPTSPHDGPSDITTRRRYERPHLPQGAPTSPTLANLCAYRLDCRLAGLARSAGAIYTRYADDLAFSGDDEFARRADRFHLHACAIAMEEGFRIHHRKTRQMRRSVRQRLAGVVVNERPNVTRADVDQLKAILTNCVRHGAASQNRDGHPQWQSHLTGRVSHVTMINPQRGEKLRKILDQIDFGA